MEFERIVFAECQQCRKDFNVLTSPSMQFCTEDCEHDYYWERALSPKSQQPRTNIRFDAGYNNIDMEMDLNSIHIKEEIL